MVLASLSLQAKFWMMHIPDVATLAVFKSGLMAEPISDEWSRLMPCQSAKLTLAASFRETRVSPASIKTL